MAKNKKSKKELERERQRKKTIMICSIAGAVVAVIAIILVIVLIAQNSGKSNDNQTTSSTPASSAVSKSDTSVSKASDSAPELSDPLDNSKEYIAEINVKNYGKITVKLDQKSAPRTAKNFFDLANSGFYDGLTFHRIMNGFMMQGGDPKGNGTGGSENKIYGEFTENGFNNPLSHTKGAISMARNSYDMNSASSQFFIVQDSKAVPSLDGKYACFGYVTEGLDLVDKICADAKPTDNNGTIPKEQQPIIESIKIIVN